MSILAISTTEHDAATCAACTSLPPVGARHGRLVVTTPTVHGRLLTAALLEDLGLDPAHHRDGRLTCDVPEHALDALPEALAVGLPGELLDASRAAFARRGDEAGGISEDVSDDAPTLRALLRRLERGWLIDILGERRLDTSVQPIVDAADGWRPFAHECLTRGRGPAGEVIPPGRLFAAADRAALLFHLDRSARMTCIENAARWDPAGRYFVNFTPTAIYNPAYCLKSTVEAVEAGGINPSQVTFEVIESVRMRDIPHLDKIFAVYRERGFTVALDDVGGGPASAEMVRALRPDYVKVDRSLTSGVAGSPANQLAIHELLRLAQEVGAELIVEGVEHVEEASWLAEAGIRLMQGYLFGRPEPTSPTSPTSGTPAARLR